MLMGISNVRDKNCRVKKMLYRELSRAFLQGVCMKKQSYNDSEKTWKSTATRSNKKRKGRFYPMGRSEGERERYTEPRGVVLQPARFAYLREPPLHAISTTILPWLAPFVLRSLERPPSSSLSFEMHRCVRSLHNYYGYREQQLAPCRRATSYPPHLHSQSSLSPPFSVL